MNERVSTSISCRGDRAYVLRLKALAAIKGISLADLTRQALDRTYGNEIEGQSAFFDAQSVASKQQMSNEQFEAVTE